MAAKWHDARDLDLVRTITYLQGNVAARKARKKELRFVNPSINATANAYFSLSIREEILASPPGAHPVHGVKQADPLALTFHQSLQSMSAFMSGVLLQVVAQNQSSQIELDSSDPVLLAANREVYIGAINSSMSTRQLDVQSSYLFGTSTFAGLGALGFIVALTVPGYIIYLALSRIRDRTARVANLAMYVPPKVAKRLRKRAIARLQRLSFELEGRDGEEDEDHRLVEDEDGNLVESMSVGDGWLLSDKSAQEEQHDDDSLDDVADAVAVTHGSKSSAAVATSSQNEDTGLFLGLPHPHSTPQASPATQMRREFIVRSSRQLSNPPMLQLNDANTVAEGSSKETSNIGSDNVSNAHVGIAARNDVSALRFNSWAQTSRPHASEADSGGRRFAQDTWSFTAKFSARYMITIALTFVWVVYQIIVASRIRVQVGNEDERLLVS